MAWNSNNAQVKNYNLLIFYNKYNMDTDFLVDETVKLSILKLHEFGHTKFRGNNALQLSPRFLYNNNLDYIDNLRICKASDKKINELIYDLIGESGKTIELFIFGDEKIANNILYSKDKCLIYLYNSDLFIQNDFKELNNIINKLGFSINERYENISFNQQSKKGIIPDSNTEIKKNQDRKHKIFYYYDLGINSIDLEG